MAPPDFRYSGWTGTGLIHRGAFPIQHSRITTLSRVVSMHIRGDYRFCNRSWPCTPCLSASTAVGRGLQVGHPSFPGLGLTRNITTDARYSFPAGPIHHWNRLCFDDTSRDRCRCNGVVPQITSLCHVKWFTWIWSETNMGWTACLL